MSYNVDTEMYEGYIYKIFNDINDKLYVGQTTMTIAERWHCHMSAALNEDRCKSVLYQAMRKYGRENFHICEIDKIESSSKDDLIVNLNRLEQEWIVRCHSLVSENGYNIEAGGDNKMVPGRIVHKYDINLNYISTYKSCNEAGRQNGIDGCTVYGCCKHFYYTAGGYVWAFDGEAPVKPDYSRQEAWQKQFVEMNRKRRHVGARTKRGYVSKALPNDVKRKARFKRLGFDQKEIYTYNSFGEIVEIYEDAIDIIDNLSISPQELRKNLSGENLCYGKIVIRYADDNFDKYPRAKRLQAISVYDICGNFIARFETIIDAERFVGCGRGEILKTIKRGGSYKNYLFSFYGQPLIRKVYQWDKHIEMCDDLWCVVKLFDNIQQINNYFEIVDCHHSLNNAIKNKTKYRGFYWKYKDEFAVNA